VYYGLGPRKRTTSIIAIDGLAHGTLSVGVGGVGDAKGAK
jgi:hypothetical protein